MVDRSAKAQKVSEEVHKELVAETALGFNILQAPRESLSLTPLAPGSLTAVRPIEDIEPSAILQNAAGTTRAESGYGSGGASQASPSATSVGSEMAIVFAASRKKTAVSQDQDLALLRVDSKKEMVAGEEEFRHLVE